MPHVHVERPPAAVPSIGGLSFITWPLLTALAATVGALGSRGAPAFYALLDKPAWAPPAGVFGPVWTVLYALMALASAQVALAAREPEAPLREPALVVFALQLAANALWSWSFFAWHSGAWALAVLLVDLLLLLATALLFGRVRRSAGWLMAPALAWVGFAGALNLSVWLRNPTVL